jgi:hypothetical protein
VSRWPLAAVIDCSGCPPPLPPPNVRVRPSGQRQWYVGVVRSAEAGSMRTCPSSRCALLHNAACAPLPRWNMRRRPSACTICRLAPTSYSTVS